MLRQIRKNNYKAVAATKYEPQVVAFEAVLVKNSDMWVKEEPAKHAPMLAEPEADADRAKGLLQTGATEAAMDVVSQMAAVLDKQDDIAKFTRQNAEDQVRRAAIATIEHMKAWNAQSEFELKDVTFDWKGSRRLHQLNDAIEAFAAVHKHVKNDGARNVALTFRDAALDYFKKVVRGFCMRCDVMLAGAVAGLSDLYPEDWLNFCFVDPKKDQARNFINDEKTATIGRNSQKCKEYLDNLAEFCFTKPYLVEWSHNIRKEFIEDVQSNGLFTAASREVTNSRRALAGAKCAKVAMFSVPKLAGVEDEKKKKRDLVRAAKESIRSLGVEEGFPQQVYQFLTAL